MTREFQLLPATGRETHPGGGGYFQDLEMLLAHFSKAWKNHSFAQWLPVFALFCGSMAHATGDYTFSVLAGQVGTNGSANGTGSFAQFYSPGGVVVDVTGNVFVADSGNNTIRKIAPGGVVTTLAGTAGVAGTNDGAAASALFSFPQGLALDASGNLYVADTGNNTIRMITPAGTVSTLAGTAGVTGTNDGTGAAAQFNAPSGVAADGAGNVYVADTQNYCVRMIAPGKVVSTLAGVAGLLGHTDAPGNLARFSTVFGIAVDSAGNLVVADTDNSTIRRIDVFGNVTTLAGLAGYEGFTNGPGTVARFSQPRGMAADLAGNVYVADYGNGAVRGIDSAGNVSTPPAVATVPGGLAPQGLTVDAAGNLYIADTGNQVIRRGVLTGAVLVVAQPNTPLGGTVTGSGLYIPGSNTQLVVTSFYGWSFSTWSDGDSSNPRSLVVPATNISLTAMFTQQTALLTVSASPTNGGSVSGSGTYVVGTNVQITAVASNGWTFTGWSDANTNATRNITVPAFNPTYIANFVPNTVLITATGSPTTGGSVTGGGVYVIGTNIQLTAVASNGYAFAKWTGGVTNNPWQITVPSNNVSYTANFFRASALLVQANPTNGGGVTGSGTYLIGSNVTISATASNGWLFTGWNDGSLTASRLISVPTNSTNFTANFAPAATITLQMNATGRGTVTGGGTYLVGSHQTLVASAILSWRFVKWNDGNTNASRSMLIASNTTLTANFTNAAHFFVQDAAGNVTKWAINNTNTLQQYDTFGGMGAWSLKAAGDVTHDGQADLFWQMASGWAVAYLSQTNGSYLGFGLGNMGAWMLGAAADVDGDGIADLIWQHSSGWVTIWYMNSNCTQRSSASLGNMGVWRLKGAGDINGDGKADLIWQSPMGDVVAWLSKPSGGWNGLGVGNLGAWELRTVHDVDGDGIADLLWQNPGGWVVAWYMNSNGTVRVGVGLGNIGAAKIMAVE